MVQVVHRAEVRLGGVGAVAVGAVAAPAEAVGAAAAGRVGLHAQLVELVELVLNENPAACNETDNAHRIPLYIAVANEYHEAVVDMILAATVSLCATSRTRNPSASRQQI